MPMQPFQLALGWRAPGLCRPGFISAPRSRRAEITCFAGGAAVKFVLPYRCNYGQHICLVGSVDKLGTWDVTKALEMTWHDGDLWKVEVELPPIGPPEAEARVEYKYVVRNGDRCTASAWTPGHNYVIKLPPASAGGGAPGGVRLHVRDSWDGKDRTVKVHLPSPPEEKAAPQERLAAPPPPAAAVPPPPAVEAAAAAPAMPRPAPTIPAAPAMPRPAPAVPEPQQLPRTSSAPPEGEAEGGAKKRGRRRTSTATKQQQQASLRQQQQQLDAGRESDVLAAIQRESDKAMQQLDAAISSSWELLEGSEDPADPQLLAADRKLAAASQRAAAMAKALDAAAAQRLLGDGAGSGGAPLRRRGDPGL